MANPLRSEAAMFRVLLVVAAAAGLVIAAAVLIDPLAGALVLLGEVGVGAGWYVARALFAARSGRERSD